MQKPEKIVQLEKQLKIAKIQVELLERELAIEALEETHGNIAAAARLLKMSDRTLKWRIKHKWGGRKALYDYKKSW